MLKETGKYHDYVSRTQNRFVQS